MKTLRIFILVFIINIAGITFTNLSNSPSSSLPLLPKETNNIYRYICLVKGVILESKNGYIRFLPVPIYNPKRPVVTVSIFQDLSSVLTRRKVDNLINNKYKNSEAILLTLHQYVTEEKEVVFHGAIRVEGKVLHQSKPENIAENI